MVTLQDGKTDYKSLTIAEDSTAEEFMDFYLDDNARAQWVSPALSRYNPLCSTDRHASARCCILFLLGQMRLVVIATAAALAT